MELLDRSVEFKNPVVRPELVGYVEPELHFYSGVDNNKNWFPENLTPWKFLPSYQHLNSEVKIRYNQLYALATNELFAIFEVDFICHIFKKMEKKNTVSNELKKQMRQIDEEEQKHARVFHRLNAAAAPEYYGPNSNGRFFVPRADKIGLKLLSLFAKYPQIFGVWVWIALFFEERSILYSKFYLSLSTNEIDAKFREIHRLHLIEEVGHVKLDEKLIDEFYLKLPMWKRTLTKFFLKRIFKAFRSPKRMSKAIANVLSKEFPDQEKKIEACINELHLLKTNLEFQNLLFGENAYKRTKIQLNRCLELKDL